MSPLNSLTSEYRRLVSADSSSSASQSSVVRVEGVKGSTCHHVLLQHFTQYGTVNSITPLKPMAILPHIIPITSHDNRVNGDCVQASVAEIAPDTDPDTLLDSDSNTAPVIDPDTVPDTAPAIDPDTALDTVILSQNNDDRDSACEMECSSFDNSSTFSKTTVSGVSSESLNEQKNCVTSEEVAESESPIDTNCAYAASHGDIPFSLRDSIDEIFSQISQNGRKLSITDKEFNDESTSRCEAERVLVTSEPCSVAGVESGINVANNKSVCNDVADVDNGSQPTDANGCDSHNNVADGLQYCYVIFEKASSVTLVLGQRHEVRRGGATLSF